jgi:sulfoxide reductase catalytic subunit YedY
MPIKKKRGWELPESAATPEKTYLNRRRLLTGLGVAGAIGGAVLAAPALRRLAGDAAPDAAAAPAPDPAPRSIRWRAMNAM